MTKNTTADIIEIMEMLPHRYPFLLIDKVIDIVPAKSATGIKNVSFNEPHFMGHFPGQPIMPGVLIIEAMAQTAAVLVFRTIGETGKGKLVYFATIDEVKFRKPVVPSNVLSLKVEILKNRGNLWKVKADAYVDNEVVTEAVISAVIMDKNGAKNA
jgi:3-hydroxyacyl-[acyl-carrier-protein] dehydratase